MKALVYKLPYLRNVVFSLRTFYWKTRKLFNKAINQIRFNYVRKFYHSYLRKYFYFYFPIFHNYKEIEIEIDNSTILKEVSTQDLMLATEPAQTVITQVATVQANQHRLSVLPPEGSYERYLYIDREIRTFEMTLECLFDHYWFPENGFLVSRTGKIWRHSILGQYNDPNFLTTHAVEEKTKLDGIKAYIFHEHLLHTAPVIEEPSLIVSHYASGNYGHFMLDMVPLIHIGKSLELNMVSRPLMDWQKPIFRGIGVDPDKVKIFSKRAIYLKKVFVSSRHNAANTLAASPYDRVVYEKIVQNISPSVAKNRKRRRIFLSRGESKSRVLRNRAELEAVLLEEGFQIIQPELLSFEEQVLFFADADIIVSEFGAVMTNVVFCRPGTIVVEIIPEMQNDPWSRNLCAAFALEHVTLSQKVKEEDREKVEIAGRIHTDIYFSFDANINLIKEVVKQLLNK